MWPIIAKCAITDSIDTIDTSDVGIKKGTTGKIPIVPNEAVRRYLTVSIILLPGETVRIVSEITLLRISRSLRSARPMTITSLSWFMPNASHRPIVVKFSFVQMMRVITILRVYLKMRIATRSTMIMVSGFMLKRRIGRVRRIGLNMTRQTIVVIEKILMKVDIVTILRIHGVTVMVSVIWIVCPITVMSRLPVTVVPSTVTIPPNEAAVSFARFSAVVWSVPDATLTAYIPVAAAR